MPSRVPAMRTLENALRRVGFVYVAGVDEVGRGCLAGPVVAASVVLHPDRHVPGVSDSKTVPAPARERLFELILANAVAWAVASADPAEIDRINIHQASLQAMRRAVLGLIPLPDVVLVDWEMPNMDGAAFAKLVRQPGAFRHPNVPMIMLTGHSERWRVEEAMRVGVNEYLLKPVSGKLLCDRLIATLNNPRAIVKVGRYYGPEPRRASAYKPVNEASINEVAIVKPANEVLKSKPKEESLDGFIFIN